MNVKYFLWFLTCLPLLSQAQTQFLSGDQQTTLVELYTSEGCSSCPPADRWYSRLREHPDLWQSVIPIAFHVDYWNYLGWPDRFSDRSYSSRQRKYRSQGSASGVYTPGVFAAGREWRGWRRAGLNVPTTGQSVGTLSLSVDSQAFNAEYTPAAAEQTPPMQLHVVVLGFGLETPVKRGENRGEFLRHDFVVLGHTVYRGDGSRWEGDLPDAALAHEAEQLAVAAWVTTAGKQQPLQAVGGWLPEQRASIERH